MLRLSRIFKNYNETGSLSEQISVYGFIGPHVFLTKSDKWASSSKSAVWTMNASTAHPRLTASRKRWSQHAETFRRKLPPLPIPLQAEQRNDPVQALRQSRIVDTAIKNRIAHLTSKADTLFSLSVYYVVLHQGFQTAAKLGNALTELQKKNPKKGRCRSAGAFFE